MKLSILIERLQALWEAVGEATVHVTKDPNSYPVSTEPVGTVCLESIEQADNAPTTHTITLRK